MHITAFDIALLGGLWLLAAIALGLLAARVMGD
jgi:hypothetical protein